MSTADPVSTTATTEPDDHTVIAEVRRGNREMFEVLVRRYNQRLFRVGLAYLRQREPVEDAMQNAYVKAYLHLDRFHGDAAFSTWLTRILINECLMELRRRRTVRLAQEREAAEAPVHQADHRHASTTLSQHEMKALLEAAIADLPAKHRVVYMLREVQQLGTQETADCLGLSPENVKVRLHRAREMLKERLLASAAGPELFPFGAAHCDRVTAGVMDVVLRVG